MPVLVPIKAVPSQTLQIVLANQSCVVDVYQLQYGLFVDLWLNDQLVVGSVLALNQNRIVRSLYLGFAGDLAFQDLRGEEDPVYTGLGSRFVLNYIVASELPTGVG